MVYLLKLLKNPERDKEKGSDKEVEKKKDVEQLEKEKDIVKPKDDRTKLRFSKENRERNKEKRESNSREKDRGLPNDRPKSSRDRERDMKVISMEEIAVKSVESCQKVRISTDC